jgi:hypothetical protein
MNARYRAPLVPFGLREPTLPLGLDPVVQIPRQRGDDMNLVAQLDQLAHDARHNLTRWGEVRRKVGTQDGDLHSGTRP